MAVIVTAVDPLFVIDQLTCCPSMLKLAKVRFTHASGVGVYVGVGVGVYVGVGVWVAVGVGVCVAVGVGDGVAVGVGEAVLVGVLC